MCHQSTCIGGYEVTVVALSACIAEMTKHTSVPDMECLDLLSYHSVAQALSALTLATMMVGFGQGGGGINSLAWPGLGATLREAFH